MLKILVIDVEGRKNVMAFLWKTFSESVYKLVLVPVRAVLCPEREPIDLSIKT